MNKQKVPAFGSEAAKARWWDAHRAELDKILDSAVRYGRLKPLTPAALLKRVSTSRVISIRLPEADVAKLCRIAAQKGLPYQTYVKSLLHEALAREERRRAG
jgi:predicted DNA binding CopG/RHH family protein